MSGMNAELQQRVQRIAKRRSSVWLYTAIRWFVAVVAFRYFKVRYRGAKNLNIDGPVIIAPVHRSHLDAPLIGGLCKRRFRSLAKEGLFPNRLATLFMASIGAFPVRRGEADIKSLRTAASILKSGEQMVVFPEGTRQSGPIVKEIFDGVSYLASRTMAAIVPVGIAGTEEAMGSGRKLPLRARVAIVAGEPIRPESETMSRVQLTELSQKVRDSLQKAFDQAQSLRS